MLALVVEVVSALTQVFPTAAPRGAQVARIEAARGEWEAFQIVVRGPARGVRAVASGLPEAHLYRVGYLDVVTPSSIEGRAGPWPDPLIPDVDAYAGERRNAFPFDVPEGEARAIWVEVHVPESAAPGLRHGAVTVTADGAAEAVPVELTVHRFAIPATSSIAVTFGIDSGAVAAAHGRAPDDPVVARYFLAALRHRISLHGGSFTPAPWKVGADGRVSVDFRAYDAEVGPFMDGIDGARFSALDLRLPGRLEGPALAGYVDAVVEHLRARGWLDRAFVYLADEPKPARFAAVRARAAQIGAGVPRLVTHERVADLDGAVEIWCPLVNQIDGSTRGNYPRSTWWYQSCMSHGCDIVGGKEFTGWPSYAVDAPAVAHRIEEWLTFRYELAGELYYPTVEAYSKKLDPWRDQHAHGGNGDGTLFYPGRPAVIGGRTDVPVESIRLKLIRDGLEDLEYLRLHAARFGRAATMAIVSTVARGPRDWEHDGAKLEAARRRIAADLDR